MQVIVLEMDFERAGFRNAARRHRLLQVDIERRDRAAIPAPTERPRYRKMIPGEPQPLGEIFRRRERTRRFGKTDVAGQHDRLIGDEPRHRAVLLGAILHRVLRKAGVDHDGLSARQARGH